MKKIILSIVILFAALTANAQVEAPDFLCIQSDTLVWNLPTNSCGSFNNYTIYSSSSFDGPYSILTTITNNLQESYFHDDASNSIWYYYMETDANCPGELVLSSDTLSNSPPEESPIIYIDIENGKTVLEWYPSLSPEVIGYVIYRTTEIGTIPIDTVDVSILSYCDLDIAPDTEPEQYFVIALDPCGNTSLLDNPHKRVLIKGEVETCDQSISLNWNLYEGWQEIDRQEVWASINGDSPILLQTLNGTDTSTTVHDLIDEANYCFYLESYDINSGANSSSNEICLAVDIIAKIQFLEIKNISVSSNDEAVLTWQWNEDAELSDYSILSSNSTSGFQTIETLLPPISLQLNNNYTDVNAAADLGPVYYQLTTTDLCDTFAQSNIGATIHLSGQATDNLENLINWTPFVLDNATVLEYEVFRVSTNGPLSLGAVAPDVFNLLDPTDPRVSDDALVCYYVVATSSVSLSSGPDETITSQSNTICIEQPTGILAPNAFAPFGVNYEFRPILIFGESADYNMTIWDRWGQKVFETNDANEGWSGRKGLREYPMGVYTYRIWLRQMSGREVEETGTVTLLR